MNDQPEPTDGTDADRCTPAGTEPDALAVHMSPTWCGEATSLEHAGSNNAHDFMTSGHHDYRAAKRALLDHLMTRLGDNVGLRLVLETDSFCEFEVTDHDGRAIGSASITEVRHD
ncbi:hypothetical protein SEA_BREEZIC_96 [Gordonia phage Breezic]|uniref:Uncharacterized protein n=1 Tax=Gordonia phage Breezic TaxID=2719202 RepID=A0A6G9LB20_9CAUD|nr:hypothetical protein SEA_BREEZIC_96 [Gordonia phage Breezic]